MTRQAICCCGKAWITVAGDPEVNGVCHCTDCKRRTGSAFGWQLYFLDEQVVDRQGEFTCFDIGKPARQQRWFCTACGSTLFWKSNVLPRHTGIAAGAFGETSLPEPALTVVNGKKCAWLGLPKDWSSVFTPPN